MLAQTGIELPYRMRSEYQLFANRRYIAHLIHPSLEEGESARGGTQLVGVSDIREATCKQEYLKGLFVYIGSPACHCDEFHALDD